MTRILEACIDCPGWQMQDDREALRDRAKKAEARMKELEAVLDALMDGVDWYWASSPWNTPVVERAHKLLKRP